MSDNFEILDSITESLTLINSSGEIVFTNKAWRAFSAANMGDEACTGTKNNYLIVCDRVKGKESKMAKDANRGIKQVINKELPIFELEYPCHSPSEQRWFILRASKVSTHPELTLLTHINITNRKLAELEVEKNNRNLLGINERIHATLYKIVHDIQNPITVITGLVELSKSERDTETLNEYLEMIQKGSSNLSSFVKETMEHLATTDDIQSVDVNRIVTNYIDTIAHLLTSKGIEIKLDIRQKGDFHTNAIEFRSILSNLIGNSIKYCDKTKPDKIIKLSFSSDAKNAILKVEDNGIGINKGDIPKLMQRSYQVNKSVGGGAGLGLYMVEKSIIKLGGSIRIHSDFGKGSEFIVEIPNGIKRV